MLFCRNQPAGACLPAALLGMPWSACERSASTGRGDWPQILGPHRNGAAENETLADTWPADGPKPLWQRPVGRGYAGLAVVGKRESCSIGSKMKSGSKRSTWRAGRNFGTLRSHHVRLGHLLRRRPSLRPVGPRRQGHRLRRAGDPGCLRLADGTKEWSHDTHAEFRASEGYFGAGSSPIVEGDKVIVNVGGRRPAPGSWRFRSPRAKCSGKWATTTPATPRPSLRPSATRGI